MANIWKIAPGYHAARWDVLRRRGCIGLGWELPDYGRYESQDAIEKALEGLHGKNVYGYGKGAAKMIWQFVHVVKPGDLVIANDGYNRVVGIGMVKGEYLAPASHDNPLRVERSTRLHHARRVAWGIRKPVDVDGKNRFFMQCTLWPLKAEQWRTIMRAYLERYRDLEDTKLRELLSLYDELLSSQG